MIGGVQEPSGVTEPPTIQDGQEGTK